MPRTVHVAYLSDNGATLQRRTLDDLAAALGLAVEAVGAHPALPRNIRPRYVLARDPATGREHKLRGVAPTSDAFVGNVATISVPNPNNRSGAALVLNIAGRMGERRFSA
jgi:hypothetical protein